MNRNYAIAESQVHETALLRRTALWLKGIFILSLIAFCFFASSICIAVVLAAFLAILIEPGVRILEKLWIPRFFGATMIVVLGVLVAALIIYQSYGKLNEFFDEVPMYMSRIEEAISPISSKIERVQDSAGKLEQQTSPKKVPEVRVHDSTAWASYLVRGVGSVWGAVIIAGIVPFLVVFMLLSRDKIYFCLKSMLADRADLDQMLPGARIDGGE